MNHRLTARTLAGMLSALATAALLQVAPNAFADQIPVASGDQDASTTQIETFASETAGIFLPADEYSEFDSATNNALDFLARKVAVAVTKVEVRQTLHRAIKKRFDGDTNVLWSSLVEDSSFNGMVATAPGQTSQETEKLVTTLTQKFPRLQIAVPRTFGTWKPGEYVPLVTFVPEGVDDMRLKTVTAYNSKGQTVLLDAWATPKRPVIVLSLNERTDDYGNLKSQVSLSKASGTVAAAAPANAAATSYQVGMVAVHLINDMEPWILGDAEISFAARSRGCSGVNYQDFNWVNLDNDNDWWAPGTRRVLGSTKCPVVFSWWEDDGGAWNFELSFDGFGLGIGMDNDDDMIGKVQLPYSSFQGTSMKAYDGWSNLKMWTD